MDSLFRESHLASLECFNQVLPDLKDFLYTSKMLCIGAGGLGCEILKCLALSGFGEIHVIDLDTIDVTNLNRQFLFRRCDVGKYKAEVAAEFIMRRVPNVKVIPYKQKIQEFDTSFYEQFTVIIAGLDNVEARRWINQKIFDMTKRDTEGNVIPETKRFLIDGGTEGFNGQARVIEPYKTACYECTLNQLPKQVQYQMCTIANNPRLPEHCIAYVYEKWPSDKPLDKDSFEHMNWIYEQALERAKKYNIQGVTYKLTMAVVKNIIPAVAATNALIAAQCVVEAVKILTGNGTPLNNYLSWVGQASESGVNVQVIAQDRIEDCSVCATQQLVLKVSLETTVAQIIQLLPENGDLYAQGGTIIYTTIQGLQEHYEHLRLLTIKQLQEQEILKSNKLTCLLPRNKIIDVTLDF